MWTAVAKLGELKSESAVTVRAGSAELALLYTRSGLFAMDNLCPHAGGVLGEGLVEGERVICPLHSWEFECTSGICPTEKGVKQRTYPVKIEKGEVLVEMPDAVAAPVAASPGAFKSVAAGVEPVAPVETGPGVEKSAVEKWKMAKHGLDVWPDVLRYAARSTPMAKIETPELERMKYYGFFYRKNNDNDHYMVRVRIPGCEMSSEQARALAYIAYESGYSLVDVTTRGNVQIQGLTIQQLPAVRAALEKVGLTSLHTGHDNIRNITSHPLSGVDPDELIDTRELARQIQAMIVGNREFSDLPRKFNIAISGSRQLSTHAWTQDLSYVAAERFTGEAGTEVGFKVLLGGNQGQTPHLAVHLPVFIRPEQALGVTAAILRTFRELGLRNNRHQVRFYYLIERLGLDQILLEIEKRLGYKLTRFPEPVPAPSEEESFIGWFPQKQPGLWTVGVAVPLGRLSYDQFEGLAVVARQFGAGSIRTTFDQNLVLTGIRSEARRDVAYALARYGLGAEPDSVSRNVVACTGKQFCNIAVTESKGYAYQLIETLRRRNVQLSGIRLHMSGCPSSCAMSNTADIGLKGVKVRRGLRVVDAFDVYIGGGIGNTVQLGLLYQKAVPFVQLADFIEKLVGEFHIHRYPNETFSQYWQRKLAAHQPLAHETDLSAWSCSGCGHQHISQNPPFFCPVCAALRSKFVLVEEGAETIVPAVSAATAAAATAKAMAAQPSGPLLWVCQSCQFEKDGDTAPELCPVCGAAQGQFQFKSAAALAGDTAAIRPLSKTDGKRVLIVGGSIGGHTAAQVVRSLDPNACITIVTDEQHSFYNRLNLTRMLANEVERPTLFERTPAWYEENQIDVLTSTRIIGLDPIQKVALLGEGRELPYDACILTHGSSAITPPFFRADLAGVCLLRTLEDVDDIIARVKPGTRVAIIGGGVLGFEAAAGVLTRGGTAQVFEFLPRLMPRQLDAAASARFLELVRARKIETHVGVEVKEILGEQSAAGIALADGRKFDADVVIVSTGIKPNIDWVKRSGIHCNRGVLVNDRMETSAEAVYAAGDVAEWKGMVMGLWANAIEQATVAATNAVGKFANFEGFLPVTVLKCLDIPLVSIGEILEDGGEVSSKVQVDDAAGTYRRLVLRNGIPVGGLLLGTSKGMGEMRKLIEKGLELEKLGKRMMPEPAANIAEPAVVV